MAETSQPRAFGDYVVDRELGRGGMGVVYAATHRELGKRVAVKVLLSEVSRDAELIERFRNEARAASAIEHPSIVEIHTVGQVDDAVYIVMELLQGESLAARLKAQGAMSIADAIGIARQVANALDAAHRVGIVHRDLKPDNVYLVPDVEVQGGERVKLLDFGIAKLLGETGTPSVARTMTGAILGTPHYMSPEQCEGAREVDARSDLYSLGCMLFQMVSGRLPFMSAGVGGLIGMHLHVPPPALRSVRPDAPEELEAVIARLLAKAPEDRIQTAAEVAAELRNLSTTTSQSTICRPPPSIVDVNMATVATMAAPAPTLSEPVTTANTQVAPPRRRRGGRIVLGASVLAAVITVVIVTRKDDRPVANVIPSTPQKLDEPTPDPPVTKPDDSIYELQVGKRMFHEGDLSGAEKQVHYLLAHDPKNVEALALQVELGGARSKELIEGMRVHAVARKYEEVKRSLDLVKTLTTDARLVAEAEAVWKPLRVAAIKASHAKVAAVAATGNCAGARAAARFGEELGESFAADYALCDKKRAAEEQRKGKVAEHDRLVKATMKRIEVAQLPIHIAQACTDMVHLDVAMVPWDRCVLATCQASPASVFTLINRAPTASQRNRLAAICPVKPTLKLP